MKITKRQLRRIIKEEMDIEDQRAMDMGIINYPDGTNAGDDLYTNLSDDQSVALDELENALVMCLKAGISDAEINDTVESNLIARKLGKR